MTAATPRFVTGSLMRHVVVMAGTGAIGLVAIFAVDLINLLYISMLGEQAIAAAVGFAGVVGFFMLSLFIGLLIGVTATVSRAIGAGRTADARALATSSLVLVAGIAVLVSGLTLVFLEPLCMCWARDRGGAGPALSDHRAAIDRAAGVGMVCSALRSDARRPCWSRCCPPSRPPSWIRCSSLACSSGWTVRPSFW
jgi:hypothetical protein